MKIVVDQKFLYYSDELYTNNHAAFKIIYIPFLPYSDARFEPQQVVLTMSTYINTLSTSRVIDR